MSNPDEDSNNVGAPATTPEDLDANQKPEALEKVTTTPTNGSDHHATDTPGDDNHGPTMTTTQNGGLKEDTTSSTKEEEEEEEDEPEAPDEEENLFITLEEQEKAQADALLLKQQPKAVEAAPRLLQAALKEGQVKVDESEEESDTALAVKKPESPEPHIHKRVCTFSRFTLRSFAVF